MFTAAPTWKCLNLHSPRFRQRKIPDKFSIVWNISLARHLKLGADVTLVRDPAVRVKLFNGVTKQFQCLKLASNHPRFSIIYASQSNPSALLASLKLKVENLRNLSN
jgi:hypothetical protein